ncbi:MAG: hypothetical protein HYR83_04865 [Planctomycetes bacterium]|nr:hypothetical protein [Planctomycetota bacterium]
MSTALLYAVGCNSPGAYSNAIKERDTMKYRAERLEREIAERDATIEGLKSQISTLQGLDPNRRRIAFGPASIEIVSRSGGMDFDGQPGDDGIMIYLRPRDEEGDAVKAPGNVTIDLLDTTIAGAPRSVAVCTFDDPDALRKTWHSQLLTQHYSLRCPFPGEAKLPDSRSLLASVTFTDLDSGAVFKAEKEVSFRRRSD